MIAPRDIVIVGLGLMGGSLAQALKRAPQPPRITAATLEDGAAARALGDGAVDRIVEDPAACFATADVVVYATPVAATLALLDLHAATLRECSAAITDVGSVKEPVVTRARQLGLDRFVGGHPLCGAETGGYGAARPDLYDGACVYLVASLEPSSDDKVARLWRSLGADVQAIDAEQHDERMAWVSHLPQVLSSALGSTLDGEAIAPSQLGPGGSDMVRLAASPPPLWVEILSANRDRVGPAIRAFTAELTRFETALAAGDAEGLAALLRRAHDWRREEA